MSPKASRNVLFAVIFLHPTAAFVNHEVAALGRRLNLKYAAASRMADTTTVQVKLLYKDGRRQVIHFIPAQDRTPSLEEGMLHALEALDAPASKTAPTSALEALAS